ncbi:MAG: OmpA family protein, partial [Desulfobulbus sp.]
KQRSQAVATYFISKGIDKNRLVVTGYGQASPIADNGTAAGRQKNRRVELHPLQP